MIQTIAFDADDTLWHNETLFAVTQAEIAALLRPYTDEATLQARLLETETRNLRLFGYGAKGFMLSMIETTIELSEGRVTAREIQAILDGGKALLAHPVELLPGVRETLEELAGRYNLMLITKGDLFHQESRIAASGLGDLFAALEIVSEKDEPTYERVFRRYHLDPATFLMVGNSLRSDILPVVALGARAIYIPYERSPGSTRSPTPGQRRTTSGGNWPRLPSCRVSWPNWWRPSAKGRRRSQVRRSHVVPWACTRIGDI